MKHKPINKYKLDLNETMDASHKDFAFVDCPSCNTPVKSDGISLGNMMGKCGSCNAVFSIEKIKGKLNKKSTGSTVLERPDVVEKFYFGDDLDLTIQQSTTALEGISVALIPLFLLMAAVGYKKEVMAVMIISSLLILISFYFASSLFNLKKHKTHIRVGKENIDVVYLPNKFRKPVNFSTHQIEQVYVFGYSNAGSGAGEFGLKVVVNGINGQKHEKLVTGMKTVREAKYLEQEIEKHLNIENQEILEEV